jgi:hypothetical protein
MENVMADKVEKVTVTKAELADAIAQAVALAMAAQPAKKARTKAGKTVKAGKPPLTEEEKQAKRDLLDAATFANFKAKGYVDIQPRINVKTFNRWIESGRRVKRGEKATICGSFPLFHVAQTEPLLAEEDATKH